MNNCILSANKCNQWWYLLATNTAYLELDGGRWQRQPALKAVDICYEAICVLHVQ
jgi:hypothetical protein